MAKTSVDKTHVFLLNKNPGKTSYSKLSSGDYVKTMKLTDGELVDNCYTLDFEGAEGRYVVFATEGTGTLSFSEIILNPYGLTDNSAYSLRDKFETVITLIGMVMISIAVIIVRLIISRRRMIAPSLFTFSML